MRFKEEYDGNYVDLWLLKRIRRVENEGTLESSKWDEQPKYFRARFERSNKADRQMIAGSNSQDVGDAYFTTWELEYDKDDLILFDLEKYETNQKSGHPYKNASRITSAERVPKKVKSSRNNLRMNSVINDKEWRITSG